MNIVVAVAISFTFFCVFNSLVRAIGKFYGYTSMPWDHHQMHQKGNKIE